MPEQHAPLALFRRLTNGVYVVGVAHEGQQDAFTAAWITQVSFEPLLIALSVNPAHASFPLLVGGGTFTVSILREGALATARHFGTQSGRDLDKLSSQRWRPASNGTPVLSEAIGYLECRVAARHPAGDHQLVLAQVVGGALLRPDDVPMAYAETGDLDGSAALYPTSF